MTTIRNIFIAIVFIVTLVFISRLLLPQQPITEVLAAEPLVEIRAIDTMKYSRDLAREKINDASFDEVIEAQVSEIAQTGASHIALGTPYETEFVPFLTRWVKSARKHNLSVWFRGNAAGWENWFEYPRISRAEHTKLVTLFVMQNPDLFSEGDIFTSCPECENGGPGDPRNTGDTQGFRNFLIAEHEAVKEAFRSISKNVEVGYYSMNGDVARLIMDPATTRALGGVVSVDHYVKTPEKLVADIIDFAKRSEGQVMLGEWGAPIPDIHGVMTKEAQADWLKKALDGLSEIKELKGMNYWTSRGSSTSLWSDSSQTEAGRVITQFYNTRILSGQIIDQIGQPVKEVLVNADGTIALSDAEGKFSLKVDSKDSVLELSKDEFETINIASNQVPTQITLKYSNPSVIYLIVQKLRLLFS